MYNVEHSGRLPRGLLKTEVDMLFAVSFCLHLVAFSVSYANQFVYCYILSFVSCYIVYYRLNTVVYVISFRS